MYSKAILPAAISDCVALIEANEPMIMPSNNHIERVASLQEKVVSHAIENSNGGMAPLTAYEIRCFSPFECAWPKLKEIARAVTQLSLFSLAIEIRGHFRERESMDDKRKFSDYIKMLNESLGMLKDDEILSFASDEEKAPQQPADNDSYFTRTLGRLSKDVNAAAKAWVEAMHNPRYTGINDLTMAYTPWILPVVILFKSLFENLLLPFQFKRWNLRATVLAVKFVAGIIILVILEIYVDEYKNFAVGESREFTQASNVPVTITLDDPPNVYSGWNLIGYILATTSTTEGTVKKGFFRAVGTAAGGFLAWLAIIICSGSYNSDAEVNYYGLIAWLTITTGVVAYFSIPEGQAAYMGLNHNTGMAGMYCAMTQALCVIEIALGTGQRDVIVANRVVATITGVVMAMVVATVPPQSRGSNLEPLISLLGSVEMTFEKGLLLLLRDGKEDEIERDLAALNKEFMDTYMRSKSKIDFLLKDASKLNGAPILRVDERLVLTLQTVTVIATYVSAWLGYAAHTSSNDAVTLDEQQEKIFNKELRTIIQNLRNNNDDDYEQKDEIIGSERDEPDLLLHTAHFICEKLKLQKANLASFSAR